jgi:hypothetical protein
MESKSNPLPSKDHVMTRQIDCPDSISQSESSDGTIDTDFPDCKHRSISRRLHWDVGRLDRRSLCLGAQDQVAWLVKRG